MTIGARLREERLRLTLSQRALGEAGGVEANAQRHYEDASRSPKANYLAAIAAVGVDVLTGERHLTPLTSEHLVQAHRDLQRYQRQLKHLNRQSELLMHTVQQLKGAPTIP